MSINLWTYEWAKTQSLHTHFLPETSSTNDWAKLTFPKAPQPVALYCSDHQTQGRGRNQRTWTNMAQGEVLLSSWCFKVSYPPQPIFTPLVGLAVYRSLYPLAIGLPLRLKAPNDILLDSKKLAGLLIEVVNQGATFNVVIGLGLNVFDSPQTDQTTTCLKDFVKIGQDMWNEFCSVLHQNLFAALDAAKQTTLNDSQQRELLKALNHGLAPESQYLDVSPQCDLTNREKTISWRDL